MERLFSPILALGLIFGTFTTANAVPAGAPKDFALQTKYSCQANGIIIHNKQKLVSNGRTLDEVKYVASVGRNQALTFGSERQYMIWPRAANGTFNKSLNVLSRDKSGTYRIVQEIDMGDTAKTKTAVSLTVKDGEGDERPVSCKIEMAWTKK